MAEIRWINKNKSCIEMDVLLSVLKGIFLINKNKSCIEIRLRKNFELRTL